MHCEWFWAAVTRRHKRKASRSPPPGVHASSMGSLAVFYWDKSMKKRKIRVEGEVAYVPLAGGQEAIIDAEDAELVEKYNWCLTRGYVVTGRLASSGKQRLLYLHRLVMGEPEGKAVDHRKGNKLDNRKVFLRVATTSQNSCNRGPQANNTSGHKGVYWNKSSRKWVAQIVCDGRHIYLGQFIALEDAAQAYKEAALKHHKEFANLGTS